MYDRAQREVLAADLVVGLLEADWTLDGISEAGAARLDRWPSWMTALAMTILGTHRLPPADRTDLFGLIVSFLEARQDAREEEHGPPGLIRLTRPAIAPLVSPVDRYGWTVAPIPSVAALAERLELSHGQLAWLADVRGWERSVAQEQLRNYRYRTLPRPGGMPRLIEAPKARLKEIQRWLLREILDQVPAHRSAHGFVRDRSAITHAAVHAGQPAVLRLDLRDFFASIPAGRIHRIWRSLGYSPAVSHVLTGFSTNVVPAAVWQTVAGRTPPRAIQSRFWLGRQLATPHLPQGAPSSPALANLAAYRLDRRLDGLATASGLRYSRYADDLTFSGSERLHRNRARFEAAVTRIIHSEGFALNDAKSAIQSDAGRQTVCGIVVNAHPNVARTEYDRLRAILHNAAVLGPASQNRAGLADFRAHLIGRVSWVEAVNPARGEKLRRLLQEVDWEPPSVG